MTYSREASTESLPDYLQAYIAQQDFSAYTASQHASWRFIMKQSKRFLSKHAHSLYLKGLEFTGISATHIPSVEEIDRKLQAVGWGAVCVRGFVPPLVFLDFQSRQILPIAVDMRQASHIAYTPAPDIVHEAAGHAPLLVDPSYREYLLKYANLARKAIFSKADARLYEAIRALSDIKENPSYSQKEREQAENTLKETTKKVTWLSEAAKAARMSWWTVEYGLVLEEGQQKIYGAGLFSSLMESRACFSSKVKKKPLTLDCIKQSYDITRPQPQLFVAEGFSHLSEVLYELEETMSFHKGGVYALETALKSETVTHTSLDSGIQISGVLAEWESEQTSNQTVDFIRWQGPSQLCFKDKELKGHGRSYHHEGFSSPIGYWQDFPGKDPSRLNDEELKAKGLELSKKAKLKLKSGFEIFGFLDGFYRSEARLLILTWKDCTVSRGEKIYFKPEWGTFDQVVGLSVTACAGGPADLFAYGMPQDFGTTTTSPHSVKVLTSEEILYENLYSQLYYLRKNKSMSKKNLTESLQALLENVVTQFPNKWLLGIELKDVIEQELARKSSDLAWTQALYQKVLNPQSYSSEIRTLLNLGLEV